MDKYEIETILYDTMDDFMEYAEADEEVLQHFILKVLAKV